MIKHALFYISSCYSWGINLMGVIPPYSKSRNFWNLSHFIRKKGKKRKKVVTFKVFLSNVNGIFHTYNKDTIKTSGNWYFEFLSEKVLFEQQQCHISKLLVFYWNKNNINEYRKQSLKIWAWSDYLSGIFRYLKFKIQRNKHEWCKTFFDEYSTVNYHVLFFFRSVYTSCI